MNRNALEKPLLTAEEAWQDYQSLKIALGEKGTTPDAQQWLFTARCLGIGASDHRRWRMSGRARSHHQGRRGFFRGRIPRTR
jgi:hypothetical protein